MSELVRRLAWPAKASEAEILDREWIVTNGLGGYACGTVAGVSTRRFHGLLIAGLPSPFGRRMMLNDLIEQLRLPDGTVLSLGGEQRKEGGLRLPGADCYKEFRIESGLP